VISSEPMDAKKQFPYQVIAVTDLANNFTPDHFRFGVGQCRDVITRILTEDNRTDSDQQIVRLRMLKYLDVQLSRAVRWIDEGADLMASVTRSLIELRFWAQFVSESPEKAAQFLHETSIDARELYERIEKLAPCDPAQFEMPEVEGKRVTVEPSGSRDALIWKLCSKLVHPSSWVINDLDGSLHNAFQRQVLATYVVHYSWLIITTFHHLNWIEGSADVTEAQ